ncbi:hypothetical protein [Pantoea cypripedii]|uniref:hypothetical protein n=1 Tax=Pantoea cypripedii TaxID=55209 RepID=UPI001AE42234|nr:hypothetical protein [Pantoea cypripedii]MBP2199313.1 hypothetical protein [Pantoea cypripedii]
MNKKITGLLLLLLPFSALSEPLITCKPEGAWDTYFVWAIFFFVLFMVFLIATSHLFHKPRPGKWKWCFVVLVDAVVIWAGTLLAIHTSQLVPIKHAVVNEVALMSAPVVQKGLRYQTQCIVISRSDTDVALTCSPGARTETVSRTEFDRALKALREADDLRDELRIQSSFINICAPDSP